jgi:oligoendopeptidase F
MCDHGRRLAETESRKERIGGETMATMTTLPTRDALPREERWDIESLFATDAAWEAAYDALSARLPELATYEGRLGTSGETLLAALRLRDEVMTQLARVVVYASLRRAEDATNPTYAALASRAQGLSARANGIAAYYGPEILALDLDPAALDRFVAETPGLETYAHYFAKLGRMRAHVRSAEVEALLAQAQDTMDAFRTIHGALENADMDFGEITDASGATAHLGPGNVQRFLESDDRAVRRAAWEQSADAYLRVQHTFAGTLIGAVKRDVFYARARGYDSALEAALAPNAIPTAVFHNLLDTVWKNLPTWHRYFAVRRKALGLDRLHGWDITAPLQRETPRVSYAEGIAMIADGLAPLGEEYVAIVRRAAAERWVDRGANIGKGGGAFSSGAPGTHPFISMNYADTLPSMSVLAHELGHSLHSYYTWQTQPMVYARYTMFAAETASNMHQALVGAHLLATHDDLAFLIELIEERMHNHLRYLFTMPILARFELDCHTRIERGEALSAEGMNETLTELYREGYGGEVEIDAPRMGITWARFSHLFTPYYVFQYATGIAAAAELARRVHEEGAPAVERYLNFLKTGDAAFPIDALRTAGVDMTDPAPVQAAFDILAGYVERLEQLTAST